MRGFILRCGISVLGLWSVAALVQGITIGPLTALTVGLVGGLLRVVIIFYLLPVTFVRLALFLLVFHAALFASTAGGDGAVGFAALIGWAAVTAVVALATWWVDAQGRYQPLIAAPRRDT